MPRSHQPSSLSDDLAAFPSRQGSHTIGILSEDIAAFCQSGISVIVAVRGRDGTPVAGLALGCTIDTEGSVRILLRRSANEALLDALIAGSRIAATFSRPADHRSIQLKGSDAALLDTMAADEEILAAQCIGMARELVDAGYSPAFAAGYCAYAFSDIVIVAFDPEQIFVQTPGPGAGSRLLP